jgi:hypothetical protein
MPDTQITSSLANVTLAYFKPLSGPDKGKPPIAVHFNPASLQYTVANASDPNNRDKKKSVQYVSQSTAKLTMDLVFDTTLTGEDVRTTTESMVNLMHPDQNKIPPNVEFGWGAYTFTGVVEQYKETLDFFSADGVPLRSSINLTLSQNEAEFTSKKNQPASVDSDVSPEPVVLPDSSGPSSLANSLGDPRAARAIASVNASASLRFGGGGSIAVGGDVVLSPPAAFSTGVSVSGGIGVGGGLAIGGGIGAGAGLGIGATAGAAFSGLRASAGARATAGAPDVSALLPSATIAAGGNAGFDLGGATRASGGGSLSADVGASADLSARIRFQS